MRLIYSFCIALFACTFLYAEQDTHFVITGSDLTLVDLDTQKELILPLDKVVITASHGALFLNKKKLSLPIVVIKSAKGVLRYNGINAPHGVIISYMRNGTCSCIPIAPKIAKQKASSCIVKVLLDEKKVDESAQWDIAVQGKLAALNPNEKGKQKCLKESTVNLELQDGKLLLNQKRYPDSICMLVSSDKHFSLDGTQYHGSLVIKMHRDKVLIINYVPLEEYLCSVLRTESWPGWPLEVNKAFAITSRSYAIAMILGAKKSDKPYHVKNTNLHQTYRGAHSQKTLKDAVTQTEGVFLAFDDMPITAMFDSCCGGIVPAHIDGVDFEKAPYLARPYACTYCKEYKIFNWQVEYDVHTLSKLLAPEHPSPEFIKSLRIAKRDKAGLVQEVHVRRSRSHTNLSAKQMYSFLKEVKSFCFSAQLKSNKVVLKGRGYGHHLGLCQWGAREMVKQGWSYKSILQFYYPGTTFMQLG